MRVRITHLKAPWPAGSGVGDVVDITGAEVPSWAAGKCAQAVGEPAAEFLTNPEPQLPAAADERDALRSQLEAVGVKPDARRGVQRLNAEIAKAKA